MTATRTMRRALPVAALLSVAALTFGPVAQASAPTSASASVSTRHRLPSYTVSGAAIPKAKGWVAVWSDDFKRKALRPAWERYSGYPGGYSVGWWSPGHVSSGGGMLTLHGYREGSTFVTGGVSATSTTTRTYGKYLVRMRADVGRGVGYVALLWPTNGGWPPEVDFAEDGGTNRRTTSGTAHWGQANLQKQAILRADFSRWHTLGVEWTSKSLKYTIDGKVWATMTGAAVPHQPMHLAIQSAALKCTSYSLCPNSSTPRHVNVYVDWVAVYRPA